MNFEIIEKFLAKYPICDYRIFPSDQVLFSENVRYICKSECERYGKSWSCPPAVGTVEECEKKCREFRYVLVYTTVSEVADMTNFCEVLGEKLDHERITLAIHKEFLDYSIDHFVLSSDSCNACGECTYPKVECCCPDRMFPCIESHGILVTDIAEKYDIPFYYDTNTIVWFGLVFFDK